MYDTIIIGGGPAAAAAAVYAARKQLKSAIITPDFGGQSVVSDDIQNWIGNKSISGVALAKQLEEHVRAHAEVIDIKTPEKVTIVEKSANGLKIKTDKGEYESKTVIIGSGARHRQMNIPGEDKFNGRGVAYCSTCDAPMFRDKKVAVVGGGNAGLEAVQDLIPYASEIYLINRSGKIKGDPVTLEAVKKSDKFKDIIYNAITLEVLGDQFVSGLKYKDVATGEEKELAVQGVFVEIGSVPNSEIVKDLVDINERGEIIIDHRTAVTSHPAIFAAGDVTDAAYKQNNISAGDGVKAALSAYNYLRTQK